MKDDKQRPGIGGSSDKDGEVLGPDDMPKGAKGGRAIRAVLNAAGGLVPFVGGVFSAISGAWSESEQEKVNSFFEHWLEMLQDDMKEKAQTILEIMARLDMNDEKTAERVTSPEYQSLVRKAFRDWSGAESEDKRVFIRNILANAADKTLTSDDVVRMFLKWIDTYSELHFAVIASIYNDFITRARIWEKVGKEEVREDSAEADMFRLLIRDLSTGGIIRQHREKDGTGHFLRKEPVRRRKQTSFAPRTMESAFEDTKGYELTELGQQFVHYAMTDLPIRIGFGENGPDDAGVEVLYPAAG